MSTTCLTRMHNKKMQFDRQMIKVQLKHFQGHPFLKETGHNKMFRCYEIELNVLCHEM